MSAWVMSEITVVIPVYNEEAIIEGALRTYVREMTESGFDFQIHIMANGCIDGTEEIVQNLSASEPRIQLKTCPVPDYGEALRMGILEAESPYIICEEIDLCDIDFARRAYRLLKRGGTDAVVGSKALPGSRDRRPFARKLGTWGINFLLRQFLGFQGTDTHGLKMLRAEVMQPVAESCLVRKDLFASELVIRAHRQGLNVQEIPIELEEQRSPSIHLFKRIPRVLKDLMVLREAIVTDRLSPEAQRPEQSGEGSMTNV